ncbi:uncharacterized protein LOC123688722 [Harmonia axyridis]|uniref:uncharacterized protein LOC123688722 n=1 Tax=Harmonia axyridis TaxID=115357 RepID=UPI001E278EBB|nr:uncharacterized protein LOC123688722 [Harmonia axyridis]
MSIFDPIGFLAPLIIKARILMQNIWRSNVDWDSEIPETLLPAWQNWLHELKELAPIVVDRYYFPSISCVKEVDLHVFCDASDKAYSSVAYFRTEEKEDNNEIHVCFVTAKYKVAPLTQQTIPKLELQGAVLACRLSKKIWEEVEYKIRETHYWTDSLVVLKRIRSQSRRFPMFVSCRIGEIHENTDVFQWHWIPSEENVADQATKELKNINLKQDGDWFSGPSFLRKPMKLWYCEGGKNSNEERHL